MEHEKVRERLNVLGHGLRSLSGFATAHRQMQEYSSEHWGELMGICSELLEDAEFKTKHKKKTSDSDRIHGEAIAAGISVACEDSE